MFRYCCWGKKNKKRSESSVFCFLIFLTVLFAQLGDGLERFFTTQSLSVQAAQVRKAFVSSQKRSGWRW